MVLVSREDGKTASVCGLGRKDREFCVFSVAVPQVMSCELAGANPSAIYTERSYF